MKDCPYCESERFVKEVRAKSCQCRTKADTTIVIPEGYVLVPLEPTEEILKAMSLATLQYDFYSMSTLYQEAIKAAQEK